MVKTNIGIIGLGFIGKVHLHNCVRLPTAQLTAVADVSEKALAAAKRLGVPRTYANYGDLLDDPNIDAVVIALPTHLHLDCARTAAKNGKDILLEKPMACNSAGGRNILNEARRHNVKLMIGYPSRFFNPYEQLKAKIDNYELGEIQVAYAVNISSGPFMHRVMSGAPQPVPEWWWKKEFTGGGVLIDLGPHMINLCRWFFGDIDGAKCYLGHRFNLELEDHAICTLKFKQGQIAIVNVGWFSQQTEMRLEVYGSTGFASASHSSSSKLKTALQLMLRKTPTFYEPYFNEISHFVDCIQKDSQPQPSGEDALKDLETIEMAYANRIRLE